MFTDKLRFDVETLIIATDKFCNATKLKLRFDVETLIIATVCQIKPNRNSCGLM